MTAVTEDIEKVSYYLAQDLCHFRGPYVCMGIIT